MPPLSLSVRLLLAVTAISPYLGLIVPAVQRYPRAAMAAYVTSALVVPYMPVWLSRWLRRHYICVLGLIMVSFAVSPEPWRMVCVCATIVAIMPTHLRISDLYLFGLMARQLQAEMEAWTAPALPAFEDFQKRLRDVKVMTSTTTTEDDRSGECIVHWSAETAISQLPCDHLVCRGCLTRLKGSTRNLCLCPYCRRPLFTVRGQMRSKLRHAIDTSPIQIDDMAAIFGIFIGLIACRVAVRCLIFGGTLSAPEQWPLPSSLTRLAGGLFMRSNQDFFQMLLLVISLMATSLSIHSLLPGWLQHWFRRHSKIFWGLMVPAIVLKPESSIWYTYCFTAALMVVGLSC